MVYNQNKTSKDKIVFKIVSNSCALFDAHLGRWIPYSKNRSVVTFYQDQITSHKENSWFAYPVFIFWLPTEQGCDYSQIQTLQFGV